MRRVAWLVGVLVLILGCDDGGDPGTTPGDMTPETDMIGGGRDEGPGDDATPEPEPQPDAAPDPEPRPDMAQPEADAAPDPEPDPDMGPGPDPEPDAALNPDAFVPDPEPDPDMGPDPEPDAALDPPDAGPDPAEGFCEPCDDHPDCRALGAEAQCAELIGGRGCLPGCAENDDCPAGYYCLESRCTPGGARCDSCVVVGCPGDQRCNQLTGQCADRAGRCGNCREDVDCAPGLSCAPVGFSRNCLEPCGDGCPEGFDCTDGACVPAAGFCDPCGGGCVGERPVCDFFTAECVQCAAGTPCAEGTVCDEGTCVEPAPGVECLSGLDCRDEARPYCAEEEQLCVACRNDADCDVGAACVDGACADADPCDRVTCQDGAACADGVCVGPDGLPGCAADAECPGDDRLCNPATGQCYRQNQQCDADGATAVCHPGSDCIPNPLNPMENVCTCARRDPNDFGEPNEEHRIPCQPGGRCLQLGDQPGFCGAF